ncbi:MULTISPECIES: hypothetical protein [Streptomyces]|uniref:hypothetical protein n=1 Tax=Streptomyces TaxID=1883 RepID=UPI0004CAED1C|nr:hypothetical protein [Streptomyces sp. NRRL S-1868]
MEHEVYVPFSVGSVRAALADRERVTRCIPGLRPEEPGETGESGAGGAAEGAGGTGSAPQSRIDGRLRIRVGSSTITYRGSLTLTPRGEAPGGFERMDVAGAGDEARGGGSVELRLSLQPRGADDGEGTTLVCAGTVTGTGRFAGLEEKTARTAGIRLLDRFAAALADSIREEPPAGSAEAESGTEGAGAGEGPVPGGIGSPDDNERAIPGIPEPEAPESEAPAPGQDAGPDAEQQGGTPLFETDVPPSSLGPDEPGEGAGPQDSFPAEAAHARRTMIGRSAEEVDHAPPRGRYAPMPAPEHGSATATLRWAAPAAAVVVAGAVVLGRVLRRRR